MKEDTLIMAELTMWDYYLHSDAAEQSRNLSIRMDFGLQKYVYKLVVLVIMLPITDFCLLEENISSADVVVLYNYSKQTFDSVQHLCLLAHGLLSEPLLLEQLHHSSIDCSN